MLNGLLSFNIFIISTNIENIRNRFFRMIIILRKLNVWFSVVRTKLVKIDIALLIWKIYYSIKLDFSKIQFLHELYVCMHDIRQKTKEGNIKNMSIFHDWTSHKKPCDHQWSYSSVST